VVCHHVSMVKHNDAKTLKISKFHKRGANEVQTDSNALANLQL